MFLLHTYLTLPPFCRNSQSNDGDHHSDHHVLQHANPAPSHKHSSLGPRGQAAARDEVGDCWPGFQLGNEVVLGGEKVAEVAEEVVEDIGLVAFPNGVQVDG